MNTTPTGYVQEIRILRGAMGGKRAPGERKGFAVRLHDEIGKDLAGY